MNGVILSCSTLEAYVQAAQQACHTDFPVVYLDRKYHVEPTQMRTHILDTLRELPEEFDTVLVAMGFCGGSWQDVTCSKKLVMPRVDDCVSLVMTTTEEVNPCTKQPGHMYVFGGESGGFSIGGIYESLQKKYEPDMAQTLFDTLFENYRNVDIIDTGIYDCYDLEFVETVQTDADRIHADLDFVPGSNLLLEKLVSGKWDKQFFIVEANTRITQGDFFDV